MTATPDDLGSTSVPGRPFHELRDTGLLWLINRAVLHPRGYAFALHLNEAGETTGWSLVGDGTEPWAFQPRLGDDEDKCFANVEQLLRRPT